MNARNQRKLNKIVECENCALIMIDSPKHGHFEAVIDIDDIKIIKDYTWYVQKMPKSFYVNTMIPDHLTGKQKGCLLHHMIIGKPVKPFMIDHIDRNTLNNRRSNLRVVTSQLNAFNNDKLGYSKVKTCINKFEARIGINGRVVYLGLFDSEEEAKSAYLAAKEKFHLFPDLSDALIH